jgi:hypothetical protein
MQQEIDERYSRHSRAGYARCGSRERREEIAYGAGRAAAANMSFGRRDVRLVLWRAISCQTRKPAVESTMPAVAACLSWLGGRVTSARREMPPAVELQNSPALAPGSLKVGGGGPQAARGGRRARAGKRYDYRREEQKLVERRGKARVASRSSAGVAVRGWRREKRGRIGGIIGSMEFGPLLGGQRRRSQRGQHRGAHGRSGGGADGGTEGRGSRGRR